MSPSRRAVFRAAGSLCLAALAGCSSLPLQDAKLTLVLHNYDTEVHQITIEFFKAEEDEFKDAKVWGREIKVPSSYSSKGTQYVRMDDLVESQPYIVRANTPTVPPQHYHFYPSCNGGDEPEEELHVEVHQPDGASRPHFEFQQSQC